MGAIMLPYEMSGGTGNVAVIRVERAVNNSCPDQISAPSFFERFHQ